MAVRVQPVRHKAQWWAEGAHVHIKRDCPDELIAGKTLPVVHGRLIICNRSECKAKGCNGLAISVHVYDPEPRCSTRAFIGTDNCPDCKNVPGLFNRCRNWKNHYKPMTYPQAVCLIYLLRNPRKGYRWCGHKVGEECYCGAGFQHLRTGDW